MTKTASLDTAITVESDLETMLSPEDWDALELAHEHLEHPSLAIRLSSVMGTPIEVGLQLLPKTWYEKLHTAVEAAIRKSLDTAISSMRVGLQPIAHDNFYRALGIGSGAIGGFFGPLALLIELPITTTLILRSIADIARSQGESLESPETQLACMQVFALGGRTEEDDAADTGYYGVRLALSLPIHSAARHVATRGLSKEGPALVALVSGISSRFGIPLSQKAAAQTMPLLGAATGAMINTIFMQHFQDMARCHFTVRRLERRYGADKIRAAYDSL